MRSTSVRLGGMPRPRLIRSRSRCARPRSTVTLGSMFSLILFIRCVLSMPEAAPSSAFSSQASQPDGQSRFHQLKLTPCQLHIAGGKGKVFALYPPGFDHLANFKGQ